MMKAIAGSMVGGLVAGTIAIVASAVSQPGGDVNRTPALLMAPDARPLEGATFAGAPATDATLSTATASSTLVQCEPYQQAMVRRELVDGREVSTVSCVSTAAAAPVVATAAYATAAPVAATRPAVVRERVVERDVRRAPKRSWAKTALVIGGTTGAGAGIGGLIGGKKGALIGAALGGGSGAIYEVTKRK